MLRTIRTAITRAKSRSTTDTRWRLEKELAAANATIGRLQHELEVAQSVVEKIDGDRNEWRSLFHTQWRQHNNAQEMLVKAIERARIDMRRLLSILNTDRKKAGAPPVTLDIPEDGAPPADAAKNYREKMEALEAKQAARSAAVGVSES